MASPIAKLARNCGRTVGSIRNYGSLSSSATSSSFSSTTSAHSTRPRHLLSIADLTPAELATLVRNGTRHKHAIKHTNTPLYPPGLNHSLSGNNVALMFSKRSTRTRISTESAVVALGGHPMFLGKDDIQLGVNESLVDTSIVVSSMVSAIVARVHDHSDVADLAKHSSVPVINALSELFHPLQSIADIMTLHETFASPISVSSSSSSSSSPSSSPFSPSELGINGLKAAWVGDSNNVLIDLAIACQKVGVHLTVASPKGYGLAAPVVDLIRTATTTSTSTPGSFTITDSPEEAVKDADVIFTDTWISMGQEEESAERLKVFSPYRVTEELARRGGAKKNWKFMHCLPRHAEEVDDEVFYGPRSLVWSEAENRLWGMIAALEGFVVNKGRIQ